MTKWRTFIDPSVGDGQNTINGIIADGSTFGVGISDDLSVTGLSTFSDVARFSSTVRLDGQLRDGDNNFGSSGQVLSSDGTDTRWVNAGSLSAGAASLVAINDDSNTNADRFITFVDSSSGNNAVKTDAALKYNPSTNTVSLVGGSIQSQNSSGTRVTLMDTDGSIEITRESGPFIDFKTSTSEDHDCRIQMENDGLTFTTGGNGSASKRIKLDTNGHLLPITDSAFDIGSNTARFRNIYADNFTGNLTGNTSGSSGSCTGNAASATILQNTRTIGGVSFNGSANINLPGVNQSGNQNTSGNAGSATVLETTRNFSISGEITANAQSFNGSGNVTLSATVDDNVIDEANLKISNSPQNGFFLKCNTGVSGGLTWSEVTLPTAATLDGTTLASGITASSITSLGTLTGLTVNGTVDINGTITLDSKNETPQHDRGVIIIQPSASGGSTGITFRSKVNSTSDHGYLWWYDDNDNYNVSSSANGENGAMIIGVDNDPANAAGDVVAIESTGNIFLNPGGSYGGASGPTFSSGKVYIGRAATKYQVWHEGNDGGGSGLDADLLDGLDGGAYQNAGNLNAGTIPDARLSSSSLFVTGMIMMYTGSTAPSGWAICNGQNGTPDLRDRFIVGAGSAYSVNNTGGANSVTLTESQIPSHNHSFSGSSSHSHTINNHTHSFSGSNTHNHSYELINMDQGSAGGNSSRGRNTSSTATSSTTITISGTTGNPSDRGTNSQTVSISGNTGNKGGGGSHENRPPYYALMFIMKL